MARPDLPTPARLGRAAAVLALALATAGGLTGCSGDAQPSAEPSAGTGPSVTASASPSATESPTDPAQPSGAEGQLAGEGYVFTLPEGWQEATERFQEYSPLIDAGAVNAGQAGRAFSDNVNVLRNADQAELPVAEAERQFAAELGTVASDVEVQERATVDGAAAVHLTGRTEAGDVTALTDQYISHVDGAYYVITFSYGSGTPRQQREEEVSSMLESWTWQ